MRKIVFNGITLAEKGIHGIDRYTIEILRELDKIVEKDMVELLISKGSSLHIDFENITVTEIEPPMYSPNMLRYAFNRFMWKRNVLNQSYEGQNILSVDTILNLYADYVDVFCIHDCIPELFPENYPTINGKHYRKRLIWNNRRLTRKAKRIITVSEHSKKDICRLYDINSSKVEVIPNAWQHFETIGENDSVLNEYNLIERQFFFSLISFNVYHKNAIWIVEAARQNPDYSFVIAGSGMDSKDIGVDSL